MLIEETFAVLGLFIVSPGSPICELPEMCKKCTFIERGMKKEEVLSNFKGLR